MEMLVFQLQIPVLALMQLLGFNLIGNPYPSSIDWKSGTGWLRTDLVVSGGGYDMWIWKLAKQL
jgi:hypothetical protein